MYRGRLRCGVVVYRLMADALDRNSSEGGGVGRYYG